MSEYYVRRLTPAHRLAVFAVTKFGSGDAPEAVYHVTWDQLRDEMKCDCPNRRRGRGTDDKHGNLVRGWLADGEPTTPYTLESKTRYQDPDEDIPF